MGYSLKFISFLLLPIVIICSCKIKKGPSKECIRLNDEGVKYLMGGYLISEKDQIANAISFFKQAVVCDSTYLIAQFNLANAYDRAKNYKSELLTLNKCLKLSPNNSLPILTLKVRMFEASNRPDSSDKVFRLANKKIQQILNRNPDSFGAINYLIMLKAIKYGKESALEEINRQLKLHPNLSAKLIENYNFFKNFDKASFVTGTAHETSLSK